MTQARLGKRGCISKVVAAAALYHHYQLQAHASMEGEEAAARVRSAEGSLLQLHGTTARGPHEGPVRASRKVKEPAVSGGTQPKQGEERGSERCA
jgi:hypothetical protein